MKFQPGSYFVGDVSYVVSHSDWQKLLWADGHTEYKGKDVFIAGTAAGDGIYQDQNGREYPVDTGTLGIIPVELCGKAKLKETIKSGGGHVARFDGEFDVSRSGNATFTFGNIVIVTDGSDDEDEEEGCNCTCCYH